MRQDLLLSKAVSEMKRIKLSILQMSKKKKKKKYFTDVVDYPSLWEGGNSLMVAHEKAAPYVLKTQFSLYLQDR